MMVHSLIDISGLCYVGSLSSNSASLVYQTPGFAETFIMIVFHILLCFALYYILN